MSWCRANASARARSRLAIATTATRDDALAPTMNDPAIFAAPRIPIRRLIAREATRPPRRARMKKSLRAGVCVDPHRSLHGPCTASDRPDAPRCSGRTRPLDDLAPIARSRRPRPMTHSLTLAHARALWWHKQSLASTDKRPLAALIGDSGWLRTLGGADAYLAARARRPGMPRADLDAAIAAGA